MDGKRGLSHSVCPRWEGRVTDSQVLHIGFRLRSSKSTKHNIIMQTSDADCDADAVPCRCLLTGSRVRRNSAGIPSIVNVNTESYVSQENGQSDFLKIFLLSIQVIISLFMLSG